MPLHQTRFRDIDERETKALDALNFKAEQLRKKDKESADPKATSPRTGLSKHEKDELARIEAVLKATGGGWPPEVCDPLFVGVRELFYGDDCKRDFMLASHRYEGVLIFTTPDPAASTPGRRAALKLLTGSARTPVHGSDEAIVQAALTLGFLVIDGVAAPPVKVIDPRRSKGPHAIVPITSDPNWKSLTQSFYKAIGEATGLEDLALRVLRELSSLGDPDGPGPKKPIVFAEEFARVMRCLHERGVTAGERQLGRRVDECLNKIQAVGDDGPLRDQGIDPPDLDVVTDYNIVAKNVELMGPMIISAMFEELKAFQVVDHLVERFQRGTLVIGSGEAGRRLYEYWREAPNRMSEMERRTFYATTMGIPGGETDEFVNRDFNDLWLRFVSSVSEFVRQSEVDKLLRSNIPSPISHQQVRKAARDLAGNLSLHGYGMAYYAALELQKQINFMIKLLGDKEIMANYGARDMWQVIDQVATLELGGAKTSSRYRTLATCGTIITAWLAKNVERIMDTTGPVLDIIEIRHPQPHASGEKAITHPNDYDLVNACELWLADTAVSDMRVEELAQPREAPIQTSRPIQVPSVVQDVLGDLGVGFGQRR
jgi:hypothetical protein